MTRRPLIIAHRGFSGRYPENTLASVRAALALGVDFLEIDVQETRDGELIVFHDYRLNRICGVRGRVRHKTLAEIQGLNPQVPTLREVLSACRGRARVLIEVKRADPRKVAEVIAKLRMEQDVIVFALSVARMKQFAAVAPGVPRFGLIARNPLWAMRRLKAAVNIEGLGISRRLVMSPRVVRRIHRRGWKVFVWTVNREVEMKRLASWGVDGIITNHPDRAKSCLARP
ncbi:MAG TPA: glycerophosphodiester phosphodiesterase [Verrucomicrobiae bacterium]|nr:glycerophosphodiester phosphodiesterase [Verrucomicrobiae bacterium]